MNYHYTKAAMLELLRKNISGIHILPVFRLSYRDYQKHRKDTIKRILSFAQGHHLIIRSSASSEDTVKYSNAGKYVSVLNVIPDEHSVSEAVSKVFASYEIQDGEEVLVQPMLEHVKKSGVILTADMDTFADYYIISFHEGADTAAVTGGLKREVRTCILYKKSPAGMMEEEFQELTGICRKIEEFLQNSALDIEFAVDAAGTVFILQVRPIAVGLKVHTARIDIAPSLNRIYKKIKKLAFPHPFLLGKTTCFGVMPDWNPAEILGVRPKKLAVSLYKELITDCIWAHQRSDYGYRDLTMHPLMVSFCGIPYIDTRITFNSFIPANLNKKTAEKLADYYLEQLAKYPKYHDKVEFEIVFSCYYLGLPDELKKLKKYGFNNHEITRIEYSLLELTNHIINPDTGMYRKDIKKSMELEDNFIKVMDSGISLVDKIYWLIEVCKAYGTRPFAGAARAAFIAVQFLRSFVSEGIITQPEYDKYMESLHTVSKQLRSDTDAYYAGKISRETFLEKYGHIRPGTYDILSKRYDEAFSEYFGGQDKHHVSVNADKIIYTFSEKTYAHMDKELEQNGLLISAHELMTFIREAIEGREYLKFLFSKIVSTILKLIEELGRRADISREDMAFLDISVVKQLYADLYTGDIAQIFQNNIHANKVQYETALQMRLPGMIVKPEDVYAFYMLKEEPNFITQKCVMGPVGILCEGTNVLEGKIIFIQSADPGYDFLFSHNIGGLVTQFGGMNSHMAIRCAELGIPAVIGSGEKNFNEWKKKHSIMIDCQKKQVIAY